MDTLKVSILRIVSSFNQRLEACLHQSGNAAAKYNLLTEEVGLGFHLEGGLQNARTASAYTCRICKSNVHSVARCVLMNGRQTEAQKNSPQNQQQKMMNLLFPLMSVFFCWQYNAAFSLYWVTSNLYSIVTYLCFNLYADRQSKKKALQAK